MIVLAGTAIGIAIGEHAITFALGLIVGWWVSSFYRIVRRNGKDRDVRQRSDS